MAEVTNPGSHTSGRPDNSTEEVSDAHQYKTVCCAQIPRTGLRGASMTLLRRPCNRLTENCNKSGCVDKIDFVGGDSDSKEEFTQRVCDCSANDAFYLGCVLSVIGMAIGLYYLPPQSIGVQAEASDNRGNIGPLVGSLGHVLWIGFVVYCSYRTTNIDAGDQLDRSCRQR